MSTGNQTHLQQPEAKPAPASSKASGGQSLRAASKVPLFRLGAVVATPAALDRLERAGVNFLSLLARHVRGDFGDICSEDWEANNDAIVSGERVLSSYQLAPGKVWVITERDRSATTVLLPSDY